MDEIVTTLIGKPNKNGKRTLLVIGGTEFSPNSPIKKYIVDVLCFNVALEVMIAK